MCHLILLPVLHRIFSFHPPAVPFPSLCIVVLLSSIENHILLLFIPLIRRVSINASVRLYLLYDGYDSFKEHMKSFCFVLPLWFGFVCCIFSLLAPLQSSMPFYSHTLFVIFFIVFRAFPSVGCPSLSPLVHLFSRLYLSIPRTTRRVYKYKIRL